MNLRHKLFVAILALGVVSSAVSDNVPVVFLHGWEGSASNWNTMTNLLVQNGGYKAEDLCPIDYWQHWLYSAATPIQVFAYQVNEDITNWLRAKGYNRVDIVAHSMGGLIVRDIVANNWNKYGIRRFVTLGTPHYGQNQEVGHTAEQMAYGSRYLWDLAEKWEYEGKKINSVLCVAGVHPDAWTGNHTLDDHLVEHWSAALSDCPVRYVNKIHGTMTSINGDKIYACDAGVADPVYLLVRNFLLYGNILNQSVLGVTLNGVPNRGGAIYFKVKDANGNNTQYTRDAFVRAVEPSNVRSLVHYGTQQQNLANAGNANEVGIGEITSNIETYRGLPEGTYRINFYNGMANDDGASMCVSAPSFTSSPITIKNDRVTVCYITPTAQNASDTVFLIDSTGSMSGQINSVKSRAKSILSETLSKSPQSRFAVVEYRDFPTSPYGNSGDFTYKVRCKFTSNQSAVISAINAISVGGGGDSDESLYSALVACANGGELGGWLNSNRSIITMTDAAPHDPEPYTGYTKASVTAILNSGGRSSSGASTRLLRSSAISGTGISLYATLSSSSASLKSFYSELCGDTGGMAASASSSDEVGALMHDLVQASTASVDADWFVNATSGRDTNSGRSWADAKKSINALDGLLQSNDVVAVAAGAYGPIVLTNDVVTTFKNINDANTVFIDGGGTNRCVTVPSRSFVFNGFVFRNGFAEGCGGGAVGGTYESCTFSSNRVVEVYQDGGEVVAGKGGAAYDAQLDRCTVIGNSSVGFGGGLYGCSVSNSVVVGNDVIAATNTSGVAIGGGGGIACSTVERTVVCGNVSECSGGGALGSSLVNSILTNNVAMVTGGAAENSAITNCTIVYNVAQSGAGVAGSSVLNSIVWDNMTPSGELSNCIGGDISYSCSYPLVSGAGNISSDPAFRSANDFLLGEDSPCIDSGIVVGGIGDVDFKGELRVYTNVVDIGAYEYCAAPQAPTNLTASSGTYFSGINLTWDDTLAASAYSIWRSTKAAIDFASNVTTIATNTYLDKDVDEGTVYYYWLKASNSGGESDFSEMVSGARAYFPPDNVNATDGTRVDLVEITWDAMPNAWYRVYRADSPTNEFEAVSGWQMATSFMDSSIEENKSYYYAVVSAINSNGDGASSLSVVDKGGVYKVATPTLSPTTKTVFFRRDQPIVISCATDEAEIRYTLDGSEPTDSSLLYNGAFTISSNTTVKAKAFVDGMRPSETVQAEYIRAAIIGDNLVQYTSPEAGVAQTVSVPVPGTYQVSFDWTQGGDIELRMAQDGITNSIAVIAAAVSGTTNFLYDISSAGNYELILFDLSSGMSQPAEVANLNIAIPSTPENRRRFWIYETESTYCSTGEWIAEDGFVGGKMPIEHESLFLPYTASDGGLVTIIITVECRTIERDFCDDVIPDSKAAISICLDETGANVFRVLTIKDDGSKGWKTVSADGKEYPEAGVAYTFKIVLDCTNRTYSVAIVDGDTEFQLADEEGSAFAFANDSRSGVEQVELGGRCEISSLYGECGGLGLKFLCGDTVRLINGAVSSCITEGQAAWLNSMGEYDVVKAKVAGMDGEGLSIAYLLNLDLTKDGFGLVSFNVSGIEVTETEVRINVNLSREGAVQVQGSSGMRDAPINGVLKLYGGETPQAKSLLNATIVTGESFGEGDTATFAYPRSGNAKFFRPVIDVP